MVHDRKLLSPLYSGLRNTIPPARFLGAEVAPSHPSPNKPPSSATSTTSTGGSARYIRTKQSLIGLLEEQKQAIIHRAVTRGLDLDVPLKPSGVEWLGDIPQDWNLTKCRSD